MTAAAVDMVNQPPHYKGFSNGAEVVDIAECLNFNRGNAVKYLARAGAKDAAKELEDLRKAAWYVQREIARLTDAASRAEGAITTWKSSDPHVVRTTA